MSTVIKLDTNSPSVNYLRNKDKRLAKVIDMVGPISYVSHEEDVYSFFIHEIIEQMLSIKAGLAIFSRLEDLCDGRITPESINSLTDEEIRGIGTSSSKVRCIREITNAVINGVLDFESLGSLTDEEVIDCLTQFYGIGTWTAKMFLIFVLNRPDVLPFEDGAFLQTYRWVYKTDICDKESVSNKCKKWKPYSSIAARYFYKALDAGMTEEEFHLFK